MTDILIIDDEEPIRHMLSLLFRKAGYRAVSAEGARQALGLMEKEDFDFIVSDIRMPGMDGMSFLGALKEKNVRSVVIMMSAYGEVETALECIRLGAYDYISKPFKTEEMLLVIRKAEERERLRRENLRLRREKEKGVKDIITGDPKMTAILDLVKKVAGYKTTVLVTGESGTGKELAARALHFSGARGERPFVAINCGAIPGQLLESELFGFVKGAFTDAHRTKPGLFQEADTGTIFLDEIGELPLGLQVKLLRILEDGVVRKVGDTREEPLDVRVVAATSRDLASEIRKGAFREDLFYRLNVITVDMPPLRERTGDIEMLSNHFLGVFSREFAKPVKGIDSEAMRLLVSYRWPGNVRELENVMERAVILEETDMIRPERLPFVEKTVGAQPLPEPKGLSIKKAEDALELELIKRALEESKGNRTKAAKLLEISHRALLYKIKNYGL